MLVLRGEFGLAKKPRSTFDNSPVLPESLPDFNGCPSVNHVYGYFFFCVKKAVIPCIGGDKKACFILKARSVCQFGRAIWDFWFTVTVTRFFWDICDGGKSRKGWWLGYFLINWKKITVFYGKSPRSTALDFQGVWQHGTQCRAYIPSRILAIAVQRSRNEPPL